MLYEDARKGEYFSYSIFWKWIGYGTIQGAFVFITTIYTLANNPPGADGILDDLNFIGSIIFTVVVIAANLRMTVVHNTHTPGSFFLSIGSILIYYPIYYFISKSKTESVYQSLGRLFFNYTHVILQILLVVVLMIMEIILQQINRILYKYLSNIKEKITKRRIRIAPESSNQSIISPKNSKHNDHSSSDLDD